MRNKIAWNKIIILHDFERSFVDRMQRTINSIQSKKTDTVVNAERDGRYVCVQLFRAGLTNVGALFGKMCGGPLPPYTVESRIESKMG